MQWRGVSLQNTRIYVCNRCLDVPQEQLRVIRLPADPAPLQNVRPENFTAAEEPNGPMGTATGAPYGLEQAAVMPYQYVSGAPVAYGVKLSPLSVIGSGATVTVTLSSAYTFTGDYPQVSVLGLTNAAATGFFTVTVVSATVFAYSLVGVSVTGSLLGTNTRIVTCNVGLPLGFTNIGQIGVR
jgi:hypothetical protein